MPLGTADPELASTIVVSSGPGASRKSTGSRHHSTRSDLTLASIIDSDVEGSSLYAGLKEIFTQQSRRERYMVEEEIDRGGMGIVYRVVDRELRRRLAMKVLRHDKCDSRRLLRFIQEAQVTGQLEHPNIVPVHELGVDVNGQAFFTMKLVEGQSLKHVLIDLKEGQPKSKSYGLRERLNIFLRICDGISFAHARGVLHRDLKPSNIMLGAFGEVQIMDWGLAMLLPDGTGSATARELVGLLPTGSSSTDAGIELTLDGFAAGTPAYMSPEQARGRSADLDRRSDVYALGAILYELLCLQAPISGDTAQEMIARAREGAITPLPANINDELRAICMQALATDPDQRYPRVRDLSRDINRWLDGYTISVKQYSHWQHFVKFYRRQQPISGILTVAMLVLTVGALVAWQRINTEQERSFVAQSEKERAEADKAEIEEDLIQFRRERLRPWRMHYRYSPARETLTEMARVADTDDLQLGHLLLPGAWPPGLEQAATPDMAEIQARQLPDRLRLQRLSLDAQPRRCDVVDGRAVPGNIDYRAVLSRHPHQAPDFGIFIDAGRTQSAHGETTIAGGYELCIDEFINFRRNGEIIERWPLPVDYRYDRPLSLRLKRVDDQVEVYLDDRLLYSWHDLHPPRFNSPVAGIFFHDGAIEIYEIAIAKQSWAQSSQPLHFADRLSAWGYPQKAAEVYWEAAFALDEHELLQRGDILLAISTALFYGGERAAAQEILQQLLQGRSDSPLLHGIAYRLDPTTRRKVQLRLLHLFLQELPTADLEAWPQAMAQAWRALVEDEGPPGHLSALMRSLLTLHFAAYQSRPSEAEALLQLFDAAVAQLAPAAAQRATAAAASSLAQLALIHHQQQQAPLARTALQRATGYQADHPLVLQLQAHAATAAHDAQTLELLRQAHVANRSASSCGLLVSALLHRHAHATAAEPRAALLQEIDEVIASTPERGWLSPLQVTNRSRVLLRRQQGPAAMALLVEHLMAEPWLPLFTARQYLHLGSSLRIEPQALLDKAEGAAHPAVRAQALLLLAEHHQAAAEWREACRIYAAACEVYALARPQALAAWQQVLERWQRQNAGDPERQASAALRSQWISQTP